MDDAEIVAMFEGAEELRHDGAGLALREGHDPREEVEELPVGAELEDEEDDGLAHEDVVQLYDVPVAVDVLQDVGLAKELRCHVRGDLLHTSLSHIKYKMPKFVQGVSWSQTWVWFGWVDLELDVSGFCIAAQLILPNSHLPEQNWTDS